MGIAGTANHCAGKPQSPALRQRTGQLCQPLSPPVSLTCTGNRPPLFQPFGRQAGRFGGARPSTTLSSQATIYAATDQFCSRGFSAFGARTTILYLVGDSIALCTWANYLFSDFVAAGFGLHHYATGASQQF